MKQKCQLIAEWWKESTSTVAFTGAGVSTESGIPDFRSPGGVWATSQPVYFDDFISSAESRFEYWRQKSQSHADFVAAQPNITHRLLADWFERGKLRGVITQNIDGLHQQAGCRSLELHGTAREVACLNCEWRDVADAWVDQFIVTQDVPNCPACGGLVKHATVSFGQSLPEDVVQQAAQWARDCEIFLTMGSSLVVQPAAGFPVIAKQSRAKLVIINRDPTPLDSMADLVINESLGDVMAELQTLTAKTS